LLCSAGHKREYFVPLLCATGHKRKFLNRIIITP
jgi:hypothetical protein